MPVLKLSMKRLIWFWHQIWIKYCKNTDRFETISEKLSSNSKRPYIILICLMPHFQFDICVGWVPEILLSVCIFSQSDGYFLIQCFSISQAWRTRTNSSPSPRCVWSYTHAHTHSQKKRRSWCHYGTVT